MAALAIGEVIVADAGHANHGARKEPPNGSCQESAMLLGGNGMRNDHGLFIAEVGGIVHGRQPIGCKR